jgi:hypothetical protein
MDTLNDVFMRLIKRKLDTDEGGLPAVLETFNECAVAVNESLVIDCSREYCPVSMQSPSKLMN